MVIPIGALKAGRLDEVAQDIAVVVAVSRPTGAIKVILETALLTPDEQVTAARLAEHAGATFVKTSTGFGPRGATEEDVRRLRAAVGPAVGVKAAGGIHTRADLERMVRAGASRIGTSSSVQIMREYHSAIAEG